MKCEQVRERLSEYEAGELAPDIADGIDAHLTQCGACSALLVSLRRVMRAVGDLPDEEPPRSLCVRVLDRVDEWLAPGLDRAPEVMTPEELAMYLRIPPQRIEDEMEDLPSFEIGGRIRFRKERVIEWIEGRESDRRSRLVYSRLRAV